MTARKPLFERLIPSAAFLAAAVAIGGAWSAQTVSALAATTVEQSPAPSPSPGRGGSPATLGWEWWNDADVQKELGLSADKVRNINDFYARRNADLRPIVQEFVTQSAELDRMTRAALVDESTYLLQVMRVESTRQRLNESRTVMLYRMYRQLTPDQHRKLQDLLDRRFNRGGRGRGPAPAPK